MSREKKTDDCEEKGRKIEPLNEIKQAAAAKETDTSRCTSDREKGRAKKKEIYESPVTACNVFSWQTFV